MGLIQKLVEVTDTKFVPRGTVCGLCGKKLGFLETGFWSINAKLRADGVLCGQCDEKINLLLKYRACWIKKELRKQPPFSLYKLSNVGSMDMEATKQYLEAAEAFAKEYMATLGYQYRAVFHARDHWYLEPKATDVGIFRVDKLRGRVAVFGLMQLGSLKKGDTVLVDTGKKTLETTVLEAYVFDCQENTLEVNLRANMGKQQLDRWQEGWLILDTTEQLPKAVTVVG